MSQTTGKMPVYNMGKMVYLVCNGIFPAFTEMQGGRTVFWFDRAEADSQSRVYERILSKSIDASKSGVPITPGELKTMSDNLFQALEEGTLR